jgi:hypothetical protein
MRDTSQQAHESKLPNNADASMQPSAVRTQTRSYLQSQERTPDETARKAKVQTCWLGMQERQTFGTKHLLTIMKSNCHSAVCKSHRDAHV